MEFRNMVSSKQSTSRFDWYSNEITAAQLAFSEPKPSLLTLLLNTVSYFTRWLSTEEASAIQHQLYLYKMTSSIATAEGRQTNLQGLAIIKRFEGFPPDVEPNVSEAERVVRKLVKVPLTSNQFSALVSFTYNVGEATLRKSTLLQCLNAGRYRAAAKEFDQWVYIGSKRLPKLVARRVAERGLFLSAS
jgi:hypothetical protein